MYDEFAADYDRFVNWQSRLAFELPFIEEQLSGLTHSGRAPLSILDAACGTGMHAIALAQHNYQVAGADLSGEMIKHAQMNADSAGVEVQLRAKGFGSLFQAFGDTQIFPFDALLCLGNSLPHLLSLQQLNIALNDFAACLRPGGLLLIQNRNFNQVMKDHERWMEPQAHQENESEWIFIRFYDFQPDGLISFNIITLRRIKGKGWQQQITTTRLYPFTQAELVNALTVAGFIQIDSYGSMDGSPFDPNNSGNLILTAKAP
jgi:glycine/sarcosine N-methyltransferase